jgi:hypothetical protein
MDLLPVPGGVGDAAGDPQGGEGLTNAVGGFGDQPDPLVGLRLAGQGGGEGLAQRLGDRRGDPAVGGEPGFGVDVGLDLREGLRVRRSRPGLGPAILDLYLGRRLALFVTITALAERNMEQIIATDLGWIGLGG